MERDDLLDQLYNDPGTRTLGQLIQERQWAVQEITRLRAELARFENGYDSQRLQKRNEQSEARRDVDDALRNPNRFIRMRELRQMVGLATSSIYRLMQLGRFPKSVHLSEHATAWRLADIIVWQTALRERSAPSR